MDAVTAATVDAHGKSTRQVNEELVIEAQCRGKASEVRHQLPS